MTQTGSKAQTQRHGDAEGLRSISWAQVELGGRRFKLQINDDGGRRFFLAGLMEGEMEGTSLMLFLHGATVAPSNISLL